MSSSLLTISFFCLFGVLTALPIETTDLQLEETTISWLPNYNIRKQIDLVSEFVRIREEQFDAFVSSTETPTDEEMIPMADIDGAIDDVKNLINKFFEIKKDLENKKKEYEMMTTTTVAPTPAPRGFIRKILDKISFF